MQKHILDDKAQSISVVIITLDSHLAGTIERVQDTLRNEVPGLSLKLHAASEWGQDTQALERCRSDIAGANIILVTMLFMDDHVQSVLPALNARRDQCDAIIGCMSAGEIIKLTRLGNFHLDEQQRGIMALLKRLRGSKTQSKPAGAQQMAMLRRLPKILRFIPGTAQDVRAYFLTLQYWLAGSEDNALNLIRFLIGRYAAGQRKHLRHNIDPAPPAEYPEVGLYHPRSSVRIFENAHNLPPLEKPVRGTIGLLIMRAYVLAGNTDHYDCVIRALEARGLRVIPAFACGLDARPAIEKFFYEDGNPSIDALVSLTGFSLIGGPAYNDSKAAEELLAQLDVPYVAAQAVEFQSLEQWRSSEQGLLPIEATMMVAIPELDGATGPMLYGGRSSHASGKMARDLHGEPERADMLAARIARKVALRKKEKEERRVAIVLFNFPPNSGGTGTAAYLSVFESLYRVLTSLKAKGYTVEVPSSIEELKQRILVGNAEKFGTDANVCDFISTDDHVRNEQYLAEIEAQWGPAPGRHQANGRSIFVLGETFGNVFVGIQPAFGYEGDPMRLLFERGFSPTHAFCAFYRYLKTVFQADCVVHFGMHGALEFMPGKHVALSKDCWPDRLIGDLPNFYLYAANNPSEGLLAKRRTAATLISYLTPPVAKAGLYRGLLDIKASIERWRNLPPNNVEERKQIADVIHAQGVELDLVASGSTWFEDAEQHILQLSDAILELEYSLIPDGLHIVGQPPSREERIALLQSIAEASHGIDLTEQAAAEIAGDSDVGRDLSEIDSETIAALREVAALLSQEHELAGLMRALDGRFIRPAPAGDLIRSTEILPTGRNLHGFDPFRIPSKFAMQDAKKQAEIVLQRHLKDEQSYPESLAIVLWGTDNLKSEGGPMAQALALIGAEPHFDTYGRLVGAKLTPLAELGRPRIDVVMTLSGIFRDLLPLQMKLLAEASYLAASADEPLDQNFVRKHALAYQNEQGCDLETAALRVFSNAEGAYGSNVNHLIDSGRWTDEEELAETYERRKCYAYGKDGRGHNQNALLKSIMCNVDGAFQNLESVELGVTTVDHYFDTLGGISRSVKRSTGRDIPLYIGDQTRGDNKVRTLSEQVALETRTRVLNPKWYESMLKHGHEGVRHIESHVTNTLGWSATTGQVAPWVYQRISQTFVLDEEMRRRLAELNPLASARVANRLLEAHERKYWQPDEETLEALREAGEELEDRLEGIVVEAA